MPRTIARRAARAVITTVSAAALALSGALVAPAAVAAGAAEEPAGSLLLREAFDASSVPDPRVRALGAACLTGARAGQAPPAGASDLRACPPGSGDAPTPGATPGYLQLTDDLTSQAGGVALDRAVPAEAGLVVEYDQFMYRTRYGDGADGIGLVLVDGAHDLRTLGAFGGSLGYAQSDAEPGVAGAYLGVGFDVYGNFARDVTGRGSGCAAASPHTGLVRNSVTLRGPGNGRTGYCWLVTQQLHVREQMLDWYGWATPAQLLPGAQRNVRVTVSPEARPLVTVEIDFSGTRAAYQTVLEHRMAEDAPATWKLGFAAATGAERNVHLVRDVEVRTVVPLSPLNLVVQVAQTDDLPDAFRTGDAIPFDLVVTNTDAEPLTDVQVHDPLVGPGAVCAVPELGPAGSATASVTCRVEVVVGAEHARAGELLNAARATAIGADGPVTAADDVLVAITGSPGLEVTTSAVVDGGPGGLVTAGDLVVLAYEVRNTGDVDLTDLRVREDLGVAVTCDATALAPGEATACSAEPYVLRDADVLAAGVTSVATPDATVPAHADPLVPVPGRLDVPLVAATAALAVTQEAVLVADHGDDVAGVGDVVRYAVAVENTGDLPLGGLVVEHDRTGSATCAATELVPGATTTCTGDADHVVTEEDLVAGGVAAVARATARTTGGTPVDGEHAVTTPTRPAVAEIALAVTAAVEEDDAPGASDVRIRYAFEVTSTGTVTVHDVVVTDLRVGDVPAGDVVCAATTLAPGDTTGCTASEVYVVTAADREAGEVHATATARAQGPAGVPAVQPVTAGTTAVVPEMVVDPEPEPSPEPEPEPSPEPSPEPDPSPEPEPGPGPGPTTPPGQGGAGGSGGGTTGGGVEGAAPGGGPTVPGAPRTGTDPGGLAVTGGALAAGSLLALALVAAGVLVLRGRQRRPGSTDPST